MPDLRVPFGISSEGIEAHAATATKGLPYYCPDCGGALILKQGNIRTPHFSHKVDPVVCDFLNETEEHWRAKHAVVQAVLDRQPIVFLRRCPKCREPKESGMPAYAVHATTEHHLSTGHRADVAVFGADEQLLAVVEILVTHEVDEQKSASLVEAQIPWVEIEAQAILGVTDFRWAVVQDQLKPFNCRECALRKIANQKKEEETLRRKAQEEETRRLQEEHQRLLEDLERRFRGVRPFVGPKRLLVDCPLPARDQVSPIDDCLDCEFWLTANPDGIVCFGGNHAAVR